MKKIKIVTSSKNKILELKALNLPFDIEEGVDLPEVNSKDPDEVAIYKAADAGPGKIVEDTIAVIDGNPIVDLAGSASLVLQGGDDSVRRDSGLNFLLITT